MNLNNRLKLLSIVITLTLLSCVCSSTTGDQEDSANSPIDVQNRTNTNSEIEEEIDNAIETITQELQYNTTEIVLKPENFLFAENPVGDGVFIYEPETRFFGVERYFVWVVLDNHIILINGATKNMTPNLPYSREVPSELWNRTNLNTSSTSQILGFLFRGEELEPYIFPIPAYTYTLEQEIKYGYTVAERKQIYYEMVQAEDEVWVYRVRPYETLWVKI